MRNDSHDYSRSLDPYYCYALVDKRRVLNCAAFSL